MAGDGDAIARFVNVSKTYDGRSLVVRDLDLDVQRGEFLTLLGPSGSGKTTTLMMLAGFEVPTSGDVLIEGRSVARVPPHRRGIGMVFQNYALFPHMTVAENVAFPLSVRRVARAERGERVARALDMVRLSGFGDRRPNQLSGGQQQRVALARALVFEPALILMDEPLGALDKQLREHMQDEIRRLHASLGISVVYVTHDQSEALTMSDRIAVFAEGRIQQIAAPDVLYERPENAFVATFIGESNRITGHVTALEGGHAIIKTTQGEPVRVMAGPGTALHDEVVVVVRPERLRVTPARLEGRGCRRAVVREVVYHGDHLRIILHDGAGELVSHLANLSDCIPPPVGAEVVASFAPGDAVALVTRSRPAGEGPADA
jgi:putative spermidine/putrescine transport system ATP-binding protein